MTAHGAPRWVGAVLGRLLPEGYAADVLADLEADAFRRFGRAPGGRLRVQVWYVGQVLSPSMLALSRKLRRRGRRAELRPEVAQAVRALLRSPVFSAAAVLSMALGIGANTAIFGVVNAVLLRPLPYPEPDRLYFVWNRLAGFESPRLPVSGLQLAELRREREVFEDVGGVWATTRTVAIDGGTTLVSAGLVTPNFLGVLGVEPRLGRGFREDEGTTEATVLVSDGMWRTELGADPEVLGRTIRLEGGPAVIVGVLPPDVELFFPPGVGVPERFDLYVPYPWVAAQPGDSRFLRAVARLRPGVSPEVADATVKDVARRLRGTHAEMAQAGDDFTVAPLQADAVRSVRPVLLALQGGVVVLLLLTAVNVASLLLARATSRRREMALRVCLGARGRRLARLVLAEVALLTAVGTGLGLLGGVWGARLLWGLRPEGLVRVDRVGLDPTVLGFTVVAAGLAACLAAAAPLLRLHDRAPMELLRRHGVGGWTSGGRGRRLVTAVELALSVVLVVGAALMAQSLSHLRTTDLGFDPEGVLSFRVALSLDRFPTDRERGDLAARVEEELQALPGVSAAGATSHVPLADWANWSSSAAPEGTPDEQREAFHFDHRSVTPGYLPAVGATLVSGRHFRTDDASSSGGVVIVDETLARRVFGEADPVGRVLSATRYLGGDFVPTPALVVGVVGDLRDHAPDRPSSGQVFWPFAQSARWELTWVVRSAGDPVELVEPIRSLVSEVHGDLASAEFRTLDDLVTASMAKARFLALLGGIFSGLALVLAALGLHGVVAYSTARRAPEVGLRKALGARTSDVFLRVVGEGLRVGLVGVVAGLAGAAVLTRYLEGVLHEVDPLDARVFVAVGVFLLLVAAVASTGPALRATRIDPARSLQAE